MKYFRKTLKLVSLFMILYFGFMLIIPHNNFLLKRSIEHQINHLSYEFQHGLDEKMKKTYPEGYHFSNAIFALSLIDYNSRNDIIKDKRRIQMIEDICYKLLSQKAKELFPENIPILSYGAFYNGWTNLVLKRFIESPFFNGNEELITAHITLDSLILASQMNGFTLIDSYHEAAWPADNMACVRSLSKKYINTATEWIQLLKERSTNEHGLINHDDSNLSLARGSSQALIQYFIAKTKIDKTCVPVISTEYEDKFIDQLMGIHFVKEYENGNSFGDIDSGPLVLGYSPVASVVNVKLQAIAGDRKNAKITWAGLNYVGLPINLFNKKYYLFKKVPMYDIFMLWSSIELLD